MLQDIRDKAQGWIAWFIVILISVPFALWGISSYLGGAAEPVVAKVNGSEITEREFETAYRQFRQRLRQQLGAAYRPDMIDEAVVRKQVLESIIRNRLVLQAADKMGLGVSDELVRNTIRGISAFQINGRFNRDAYERGIRTQGLTATGFEGQIRQAIISEQLSTAVKSSAIVTNSELERLIGLQLETRNLDYLVIPAAGFKENVTVPDDEAKRYYETHQQAFAVPERMKVEYLDLAVNNIARTLKADDELLQGYFEQNKSDYQSSEQRRARHILIVVEEGADEETANKAREAARVALERVNAGEDFATVARELSQDPGSAEMGGDLGFFEKGVMEKEFEQVVFTLEPGDVSELVRTPFGFHVIKLTEIRLPEGKSFDQAREEIRSAYLKSEAGRLFYEYAERLNDLAYEDPDSLQPAADALGMKTQVSGWITRDGGEGIFSSPKAAAAAFSDDVLAGGHNSEAIELDAEHIMVLRVAEHEESSVQLFDSVKAQIDDILKAEKAAKLAREKGEAMLARLRQGATMEQLSGEGDLQLFNKGVVGRNDKEIPPEVLSSLFKMPKPEGEDPVYGETALQNGDSVIIALGVVKKGDPAQAEKVGGQKAVRDMMRRAFGDAYYRHLLQNLRDQAKVEYTGRPGEG
jgi:peptidyl-prolyl cis-trans isomerase D